LIDCTKIIDIGSALLRLFDSVTKNAVFDSHCLNSVTKEAHGHVKLSWQHAAI